MKKLLVVTTALFLAACGTIGNTVISDASLQEKAAFALNTTADRVTISNRKGDIDSVKFVATTGGHSYQCYITIGGVISSDALCSGSNSVKSHGAANNNNSKSCNALLKAAGRC